MVNPPLNRPLSSKGLDRVLEPAVVPYYSQFATPDAVDEFLAGRDLRTDELWPRTGAPDVETYARWGRAWCGLACLQSVLAHRRKTVPTLYELAELAIQYRAYLPRNGGLDGFDGMYYQPFVDMLTAEFDIAAAVAAPLELDDLISAVTGSRHFQREPQLEGAQSSRPSMVIASVHNSIRDERTSGGRGGHLVLVTGMVRLLGEPHFIFHNPSGKPGRNQADATLSVAAFETFYAGRGVIISEESPCES